jgi:two-component sensor histidine kinase
VGPFTGKQIKLELSDNGIGITHHEEAPRPISLGMNLIKRLTNEMMGDIAIENKNGIKITIHFDHDALNSFELSRAG